MVEAEGVVVLPETVALCRQFGIDPLGAISSGALLLTIPFEAASDLIHDYAEAGITAAIIGEILPPNTGLQLRDLDGNVVPLPEFVTDEIAKLYT